MAPSSSGAAHHLARVDRRVVDGADALHLVGDELVLLVEEKDAELLVVDVGHCRAAIVEQGGGGAEIAALLYGALREAAGGGLDDLQLGNSGLAQPGDLVEPLGAGGEHLGERAEARSSALATGFTSRRGMARNRINSRNS